MQAAVAGAGDHQPLRAGRHQRIDRRASCASMAGDQVHHRPLRRVGRQPQAGGVRCRGRCVTVVQYLAILHPAQRPGIAGAEGIDPPAVLLAQVGGGEHLTAQHGLHARPDGLAGQRHGIQQVLRAVGL